MSSILRFRWWVVAVFSWASVAVGSPSEAERACRTWRVKTPPHPVPAGGSARPGAFVTDDEGDAHLVWFSDQHTLAHARLSGRATRVDPTFGTTPSGIGIEWAHFEGKTLWVALREVPGRNVLLRHDTSPSARHEWVRVLEGPHGVRWAVVNGVVWQAQVIGDQVVYGPVRDGGVLQLRMVPAGGFSLEVQSGHLRLEVDFANEPVDGFETRLVVPDVVSAPEVMERRQVSVTLPLGIGPHLTSDVGHSTLWLRSGETITLPSTELSTSECREADTRKPCPLPRVDVGFLPLAAVEVGGQALLVGWRWTETSAAEWVEPVCGNSRMSPHWQRSLGSKGHGVLSVATVSDFQVLVDQPLTLGQSSQLDTRIMAVADRAGRVHLLLERERGGRFSLRYASLECASK
ncbi:MAG: hypothetical protein JNG84_08730 [Archangium sp.]|nr:hypothetical protein [Archangium sp.]